jgi:7-cyano-7-deazaguanine tRNA-ribosyltransferase
MSFEIKEKDVLGRLGKLKTKNGLIETPILFPVVNPSVQLVSPRRLKDSFGFEGIITNSYLHWKRNLKQPPMGGLHNFLDFDGVIMTDSGAYQILVYGNVEVTQEEIVSYQEEIGSDIATILDIPTGWNVSEERAQETVAETLRRAEAFFRIKKRDDILWVGPVQGGRYLDLVAKSAQIMGKLPFQIHALGSPTEIMESYRYDVLVDMIMSAKMNLPTERPLHLFGAGHPHMMALAVALGCDLFDSAAYALYARDFRYMTENGTWRLGELNRFPCQCPKCAVFTPSEVQEMPKKEREQFLAEHNLHVCVAELKRIKQAIRDGRLWELVEMRAHSHPALLSALKNTKKYETYLEKFGPVLKQSGLFFFDSVGLARPEIVHYREKLSRRYHPPKQKIVLILLPQTRTKPFHKSEGYKKLRKTLNRIRQKNIKMLHVCFYAAPFGLIPIELDEVYPLSQNETAMPLDCEVIGYVANQVGDYIKRNSYKSVILLNDPVNWGKTLIRKCMEVCAENDLKFKNLHIDEPSPKEFLIKLENTIKENLSD